MTNEAKQKLAASLSWVSVALLLVAASLLVCTGCGFRIGRPETPEALVFSNAMVKAVSYGSAYAIALDDMGDLTGMKTASAQAWARRADVLATAGEILAATSNKTLDTEQLTAIKIIVQTFHDKADKSPEEYLLAMLDFVPWWAASVNIDIRDRAQLCTFCTFSAKGITEAWTETKKRKGW